MYEFVSVTSESPIIFRNDIGQFLPHWHESLEILYITNGHGTFMLNSEQVSVGPEDIIVVNANKLHQFISTENNLDYYYMIISANFLNSLGLDMNKLNINNHIQDSDIRSLFLHVNELFTKKPVCYIQEACADALKIVSLLIREYLNTSNNDFESKKNAKQSVIREAILYMRKNYGTNISLEDIASHFGFNKSYFCRIFKEIAGVPAIKMLNAIRCEEAKQLLLSTNYTISEVADRCCFTNFSYFTKTYKSIVGCLPSQTKALMKNNKKIRIPMSETN